jgi:hypothetical protein
MNIQARIDNITIGTALKSDGGFNCLDCGEVVTVAEDKDGMFVPCRCGRHYLEGQVTDEGVLVGFALVVRS